MPGRCYKKCFTGTKLSFADTDSMRARHLCLYCYKQLNFLIIRISIFLHKKLRCYNLLRILFNILRKQKVTRETQNFIIRRPNLCFIDRHKIGGGEGGLSPYAMLCYAMLCYAMLCYAMLCYAMPCYAMPCHAMLCYAMLCYAMPCYAMLCYAMLCYAMLCHAMLCYAMLFYAMLCYAMLCYAMLCYAMRCYVMLCCVMLCLRLLEAFPRLKDCKEILIYTLERINLLHFQMCLT